MAVADPTLEVENELFASGARYVIGCDEVGRGAIAGPVAVGLCAIDAGAIRDVERRMPEGLRDSKMLSERRREAIAPLAAAWATHSAVGLASAEEVDRLGITACLGLAGKRALAELHAAGLAILDSVLLLDGHQDWLNPALETPLTVRTRIKADRDCGSVAAASVIAKVHRDRLMIAADAQ
ncbi:MAG TPA: ribonuclease HII, partial [Terrimesophilobacter sp.]|nr:ribonuclease HII [Terrimesophilobacter sp.]